MSPISFRTVLAAALDTIHVNRRLPGPTQGLVPLSSVLDRMTIATRNLRGSLRDAWGRPVLHWSDGQYQFDYSATPPYAEIPRDWAGTDPADDLLIVDGVGYRGPMSQSELLVRAMRDLRAIGTACESYAVDNNIDPGPVEPIEVVGRVVLPSLDPWGHPYLFWSSTYAYGAVSYGPGGQPDYPYATWGSAEFNALHTGPTTGIEQDLVFVNG